MRVSTKRVNIFTFLIVMAIAIAAQPGAEEAKIYSTISDWIKHHAVPFKNSNPASDIKDLLPLKNMVGDAQIAALGEATHGTREFFQMKHRILKFLVTEMEFNTFAIEASWPESLLVNRFIKNGKGDPKELLKGLHCRVWFTQEILDMILWMREYNQTVENTKKISFYGFDIQAPTLAMKNVIEYLSEVDPPFSKQAESFYSPFLIYQENWLKYQDAPARTKKKCYLNLQKVYLLLKAKQQLYEKRSKTDAYRFALHNARVALQSEAFYAANNKSAVRNLFMAENVTWLREHPRPNAKIVLWAHNDHVGYDAPGDPSMAFYLKQQYGKEMLSIGFGFYKGTFNAYRYYKKGVLAERASVFSTSPAAAGSYGGYFQKAELPHFILDMRGLELKSKTAKWLIGPRRLRSIGAAYDPKNPLRFYEKVKLPEHFDIFIYFEESTPSGLLSYND